MMDTKHERTFKTTPMAFASMTSFIDDLASRPLPPAIDRSMMGNRSGTGQRLLFAALESFELIDPQHRVLPSLEALATTDVELRKAEVTKLLRRFYPDALAVSEVNGTYHQLEQSFNQAFGPADADTRRKAITFFLHALAATDLHVSANFPKTRAGSGASSTGRKRPRAKRSKPAHDATAETTAQPSGVIGEEKLIPLGDAGQVKIHVAVKWLDLPDETFMALRKAIRDLEALGTSDPAPPDPCAANGYVTEERGS